MLFSEVYGTYYNVLAKLLEKAVDGALTKESMDEIIRSNGFDTSSARASPAPTRPPSHRHPAGAP